VPRIPETPTIRVSMRVGSPFWTADRGDTPRLCIIGLIRALARDILLSMSLLPCPLMFCVAAAATDAFVRGFWSHFFGSGLFSRD